ncbi:hypothetical protein [Kibdelosporangium phytohabitans]|uniref:Uncharacterized protein n=1 Tax=Kibdelosporangium phytohabitans TaxID=860235 RepID=A0A0N9HT59_9PSEU|nr:hypothetical protein [Kibdelosporangium phytohabitans]ALG08252.1 hypothetical protein AOZ06_16225 [Kibdelosporangium phytohabitans]MBE1470736.1 hypothetical protein [Kibdelosporangium phytohabitans]
MATTSAVARPGDAPAAEDIGILCTIPPDRDLNVTRTVRQVARDLNVSDKVLLSGFEAGWVETRMNNLTCGDRDSLGVFQQRPSQGWGTPEQIMNVSYAATKFFNGAIASERNHPEYAAWQIAQDVQRSCCPDRYAAAEGKARTLITEVGTPHSRFVFVNAAGDVFAKDDPYGAWVGFFSGGVTKVVASGDWTGVLAGGNFYAKQGLYGSWLTLAGGGDVRDIAVSGNRFAFVSGAGLFAKDGVYSSWVEQGSAGSRVVLDGDWIGFLGGGVFYAKKGLYGAWLTMSGGGGVTDIAIEGDRFAYATNGGVYAKDGAYSSWVTLGGGGTKVVLDGDWIGVLSGGNFHAKQGLYGSWLALAGGGGVTDITMSGGWFGMAAGGNFLAKQGEYSSWTTFAGGGQVIATAITSFN